MQILTDLFADIHYAARALRRAPAFTFAAVGTLAIGIGCNTTIFSAVNGILLEPLPFVAPDKLISVFQYDRKRRVDHDDVAPGNFADWRERNTVFTGLAAAEPFALSYSGPDGQEQVYNWNVTQDFFQVLNTRASHGRLLQPGDFVPGADGVVVLTYGSWQRRFGADTAIIGKQLTIGGKPVTIVGVLPPDFAYLANSKMEIYAPKVLDAGEKNLRNMAWYHVVGRLKPGITLERARDDMRRVAAQLAIENPATNAQIGSTVEALSDTIVGDTARPLFMLLGAVILVLLIACVNVGNLVMARAARRGREFAIRAAVGADRWRVVRQVLAESLLLATAGGLAGIGLAIQGVGVLRALSPATLPRADQVRLDGRALGITLAAVIVATIVSGLVPALRAARPNLTDDLRTGGRSVGSGRQRRVQALFVITEVALAMVLLVGTGLLVRSFVAVVRADRGYRTDHVLAATVFVYDWNKTPGARRNFVSRLVDRIAVIPGVVASGATSSMPLDMAIEADKGSFTIPGRPVAVGEEPSAHLTSLTPGAFSALRIPLRRGRLFSLQDDSSAVPVAIASESFARRYWPSSDAIGQHVKLGTFYGPPTEREIVGVVADVRQVAFDAPVEPTLYVPHAQAPTGGVVIVARTEIDPTRIERSVRRAVAELNPALPIAAMETMDELTDASLRPRRFALTLFVCFALTALALAVIGVYGVMSQGTVERWREFGIRVALGAGRRNIVYMVMRQGAMATAIGIALGIVGATIITALLRSMLFGVAPFDALTFGAVAVLLFTTAMAACYLPARRATGVDPLTALRVE